MKYTDGAGWGCLFFRRERTYVLFLELSLFVSPVEAKQPNETSCVGCQRKKYELNTYLYLIRFTYSYFQGE